MLRIQRVFVILRALNITRSFEYSITNVGQNNPTLCLELFNQVLLIAEIRCSTPVDM